MLVRDAIDTEDRVLSMLRRQAWIIVLVWALTIAAAAWLSAQQERVYRASASLVAAPDWRIEDPSDVLRSLETLERRTVIATFARIPAAPDQRAAAAAALGLDTSDLRAYRIAGSVVPNTNVLRIDVDGPDPERAAAYANALADATASAVPALYRTFALRPLERAEPRSRPIQPDTRRNLVVAAIAGLFVGLGAGVAGESLRRITRRR